MTNYNSNVPKSTQETYQHPWYSQQSLLENTTTSESQSQQKPKPETTGLKSTNKSLKGDYWESIVQIAAWDRNADVYPNKGCTGSADMVLGINGEFIPIDVKSMRWDFRTGHWKATGAQKENAWIVYVNPETREIRWPYQDASRKSFQCPEGLEGFWD